MPPILYVQLLGDFNLVYGDAPVNSVNTLRLQSLLTYLILHRDAPQSRQHLSFLFWPDSPEAQARTNFRNLFHLLREALPDADLFLGTDGPTVQWRSDAPFTSDVIDFEIAAGQASSLTSLQEVVNLYHGHLLPECYADWILPERERLHEVFIETLKRLALLLENAGDYHSAISYTERLLRQDPLREETYRHLMRLYALNGDRASVIRIYQTCVTVLKRELDTDVSPTTLNTYEQFVKLEIPPVRTTEFMSKPRSNNLPIQLTSFIGREREVIHLKELLDPAAQPLASGTNSGRRLVTLTGAGGCGKSRLAIQVATELLDKFKDGVWLVELASLSDPALVPVATATVLGIREPQRAPLIDALIDYLQSKELLLILDNCEHLLSACAQLVATLLHGCPNLRLLTTSTERLKVAGEAVRLVPTLSVPRSEHWTSLEELNQSEAVRLFIERAVSALPSFTPNLQQIAMVVKICQHLDGIPLAIELAAARVKMLSIEEIVKRLDDRFRLLVDGGRITVTKHQTLLAAMEWSHQLLSSQEQVLFRRLSIFAGGFTLEAAEKICGDQPLAGEQALELLASLTDKSLVVVDRSNNATRFQLLETIRAYARQKLIDSGEVTQIRDRHLEIFLDLAEQAEPELMSEKQREWIQRLEREHDNLREALEWSKLILERQSTDGEIAAEHCLRLAGALWQFWNSRYPSEGLTHLVGILSHIDGSHQTAYLAKAVAVFADLAYRHGNYASAFMGFDESLTIWRDVNDQRGIAFSLRGLGNVNLARGDLAPARSLYEQSLAICREIGDRNGLAFSLSNLGLVAWNEGDYSIARNLMEESLKLRREMGDQGGIAYVLNLLGSVASSQRDYIAARRLNEESLAIKRELDDRWGIAYALESLGLVASVEGDYGLARTRFKESLALFRELGDKWGIISAVERFASLATTEAQSIRAVRLYSAAETLRQSLRLVRSITERGEYDHNVASLHLQLNEEIFTEEWSKGHAMTMEQTIEYSSAVSS